MIRKILVPVRGDGKGDNVLAHAAALAHRHNAHIDVSHCRPKPEDLLPFGIPIPSFMKAQMLEQVSSIADMEEEGLKQELEALAAKLNLSYDQTSGKSASVSFSEEAGRQVDVIKRRGRLVDVIAVAKPDVDRNLGTNTLKAALFHSGRPVLMCPDPKGPISTLGANVAIAWNGSAEAARALGQSMPVIRHADTVSVLTNGSDAGPGTTIEDVQDYLSAHGISANIVQFETVISVAESLLKQAAQLDADTLVMGAYGDSHERETLFGGNTQHIVDHSEMAVLFSH